MSNISTQSDQLQLQIDDLRRQLSALDIIVADNIIKTTLHISTTSGTLMTAIDLQSRILKKIIKAMVMIAEKLGIGKKVDEVLELKSDNGGGGKGGGGDNGGNDKWKVN